MDTNKQHKMRIKKTSKFQNENLDFFHTKISLNKSKFQKNNLDFSPHKITKSKFQKQNLDVSQHKN